METGVVKIAEDSDFDMLKMLVDDHTNWKLEYDQGGAKVWTKSTSNCSFKMVKVQTVFQTINANTLFDVLHDPDYRKEWDEHMQASIEIGYLNPNNDVGYYALSCPTPVKNRDFVLQRSWLDMGNEKLILNHSVEHKDYASRKGYIRGAEDESKISFVPCKPVLYIHSKNVSKQIVMQRKEHDLFLTCRAISHLTGFVIRTLEDGCFLGYISQTDPKGKLPPWLVNKITQKFAPKVVKQLRKAAEGYESWKTQQRNPMFKPWVYPELTLLSPRVNISDCVALAAVGTTDCEGDSD